MKMKPTFRRKRRDLEPEIDKTEVGVSFSTLATVAVRVLPLFQPFWENEPNF